MSRWLRVWTHADVVAQETAREKVEALANYMQQSLGVPYPTQQDRIVLHGKAKLIFENYPHADWKTLCKIVDYCKSVRYRPARMWKVLDKHRQAWSAGWVPELDFNYQPPNADLDDAIAQALSIEERPGWRRRLMMAQRSEQKEAILSEWRQSSSSYH